MMYGFVIAPSINNEEGSQQYFEMVRRSAESAISQAEGHSATQMLEVCEYLDLVDARTLVAIQPLYRQCVALVSNYLSQNSQTTTARTLTKKSWAAKTLNELVLAAQAREDQQSRRSIVC